MNPGDPLAQLRDIHLPQAVSWWPPAPGWWLLALLSVCLLCALVWFYQQWRQQRRYRHEALSELRTIDLQSEDAAEQICTTLRRTAKTAFPQYHWEALPTPEMLAELNACCAPSLFEQPLIERLAQNLYRRDPELPAETIRQFHSAASRWVQRHTIRRVTC